MQPSTQSSRRRFLKNLVEQSGPTLAGAGLTLLTLDYLFHDRSQHLPPDVRETVSRLVSTPVAKVEPLKTAKFREVCNVTTVCPESGVEVAPHIGVEIPVGMENTELPQLIRKKAAEKLPDQRVRGSGFVLQTGARETVVTCQHNLRNVNGELERLTLLDVESDIGVIDVDYCTIYAPSHVRVGNLSSLTNNQTNGREVRIYGFGARRFWEVQGEAIYLPRSMANYGFDAKICGCFALKCPTLEKIHPAEFIGLSGGPALDLKTDQVLGVYHAVQPDIDLISGASDTHKMQLLVFSGPDELRGLVERYTSNHAGGADVTS